MHSKLLVGRCMDLLFFNIHLLVMYSLPTELKKTLKTLIHMTLLTLWLCWGLHCCSKWTWTVHVLYALRVCFRYMEDLMTGWSPAVWHPPPHLYSFWGQSHQITFWFIFLLPKKFYRYIFYRNQRELTLYSLWR